MEFRRVLFRSRCTSSVERPLDRCIRKGSGGSQSRRLLASDGTAERGFMSKVWLITGASRGLGRAFTQAVLDAGDRVIATARKPEQLVGLKGRYSERVRTVALDVTNDAQAKAAFEAPITSFGALDYFLNNPAYRYVCPLEDTSLA